MPTSAQQREAERVTVAFQAALAQQGVAVTVQALSAWEHVPPGASSAVIAKWLTEMVTKIMSSRSKTRELGLAYYRLVRALRTGKTVADTRRDEPKHTTLDVLRQEFETLRQGKSLPEGGIEPPDSIPADQRIEVEEVLDTQEMFDRQERNARAAAPQSLADRGPGVIADSDKKAPDGETAGDADERRQKVHTTAGSMQAAAAARHAMNGARSAIWEYASKDGTCIGWIRISTTGSPCAWCAMLMSRGPVYKTRRTAMSNQDGDSYHDSDKCIAEPVFSDAQYNSDLYSANRYFQKMWPIVTKGLGQNDAINAWRSWIDAERRTVKQAQAA